MGRATFTIVCCALFAISTAVKTVPLALSKRHPKRCLNLGSWFDSAGPFEAELGLVKYSKEPAVLEATSDADISRTSFNKAFRVQRTAKTIRFSIKVEPGSSYSVTTAHAEIVDRYCKKWVRVIEIGVNRQKRVVDVFKRAGCLTAVFFTFENVEPTRKGLIKVRVKGVKGQATIAGICIRRNVGPSPSTKPRPSKNPLPSQSSSPRPSPSASKTPAPSPSNTPAPSISSTPAPSPSTSPKPFFGPSKCVQRGCMNFEGHGDYKVIGNSMSYDEDRENCAIKSYSSAPVRLPHGAVVKKAILYWSASGYMNKAASAYLNGYYVAASRTYRGGSSGYHFYGAEADVTHMVKGSGDYTVSKIWYDNRGLLCHGNAAYAAWSMVILYELRSLPLARINVCTDNFKFTFPSGMYNSAVYCIAGKKTTRKAKTTVVAFESDRYKGEHFFINGKFLGNNLFRGQTAPNLDILEFDVTHVVRTLVSKITYTVRSFLVHTRFGRAIEGLFMPVRVVYYTIDH